MEISIGSSLSFKAVGERYGSVSPYDYCAISSVIKSGQGNYCYIRQDSKNPKLWNYNGGDECVFSCFRME